MSQHYVPYMDHIVDAPMFYFPHVSLSLYLQHCTTLLKTELVFH